MHVMYLLERTGTLDKLDKKLLVSMAVKHNNGIPLRSIERLRCIV